MNKSMDMSSPLENPYRYLPGMMYHQSNLKRERSLTRRINRILVTRIELSVKDHETDRGVRAFMGWTHILGLEYSPATRTDNPWIGYHSQPVMKVSVLLPPGDWLCKKLENCIPG